MSGLRFASGILIVAALACATEASAQSKKTVHSLLASKAVQTAKRAGHVIFQIKGCVQNVPYFVITHCKYVTMNNVNYSAAVLSEVPGYGLINLPVNVSAPQIPPGTSIVGYAATVNGPSVDCWGAPVPVTGAIVLAWAQTGKACPAQ